MLASTTSVEDSGLLETLLPAFHDSYPIYHVKVIAVGSGEALALGARGDADVVIAHSPDAEERFLAEGHGRARMAIMRNDFVLAGPSSDPAGTHGMALLPGLRAIAAARAPFVSRGDDSGTHVRERALWAAAGMAPDTSSWYMAVGQGMGEALRIASERAAYTLTDRATYVALRASLMLGILIDGDQELDNVYSVMTTSRGRNHAGADALAAWLTTEQGQTLIGSFGTERFGRRLFEPMRRDP